MNYQVTDIIKKKRSGQRLSESEIAFLIDGYLDGTHRDYHMSAWLMAVFFRGMEIEETRTLARLMWKSGITLPRESRKGFWVDKHSTGGVGDKTSLLLVPIVTAVSEKLFGFGSVKIPMISGRGLDFTGGTLDKLDSVPGFSSSLPLRDALGLLEKNGYFMMGQTEDLAPADRLLYALRDVTGTVECLPLIVSSILSKKFAENLDGLVFDVKFGSGAFMPERERARDLAVALCETARAEGVKATAFVTYMGRPLGTKVGHQLEVEECIDYLRGMHRDPGLHEVTLALAAEMVALASRGKLSFPEASAACEQSLAGSRPAEIFVDLFEAQGGDWKAFEANRARLERRPRFAVQAPKDGYIHRLDARSVGVRVRAMGGGRQNKEAAIDLNVGAILHRTVGDWVRRGDTVLEWVGSDERSAPDGAVLSDEGLLVVDAAPAAVPNWIEEVMRAE